MPELINTCAPDCACTPPRGATGADAALPLACDLAALPAAERSDHEVHAQHLLAGAQATQELPDGYSFHYPAAAYPQVAAFIDNERRCCPFFTFTLLVPAGEAPLELRITGAPGVKEFLHAALEVITPHMEDAPG